MRIIFFSSSEFGAPILEALHKSHHDIAGVVTAVDKPKGRHLRIEPGVIEKKALELKLTVFTPDKLNDINKELKALKPDVFVVVSYGKILDKAFLEIPKIPINIHPSLLPKYRGPAPINWAIINGDDNTGITIIRMNEFEDKGDIILQEKFPISADDNSVTLSKRLSGESAKLILKALDLAQEGRMRFVKQDDSQASKAPRLKKEDGLIDWNARAVHIQNKVRGLKPWPGAYTYLNGKLIKIFRTEILAKMPDKAPGQILDVNASGICVAAKDAVVIIKELQPQAGKRMAAGAFLAGHKIHTGNKFSCA